VASGGIATPSDCQIREGASPTCSESRSMRAGGFSGSSSRETEKREKEESRGRERTGEKFTGIKGN